MTQTLSGVQPYNRRPIPNDVALIPNWLGQELNAIQRAIAVPNISTKLAAYTLILTDDVVLVDCTAVPVTITFPDPTRAQNKRWTIKKIDATANAVTFTALNSGTFDGAAAPTLATQYKTKIVVSNGIQYYVLASF